MQPSELFCQFAAFCLKPSYVLDAVNALLGICVGSFLNVVALRSLDEKSWIHPPSSCPHCKHRLAVADLVPVVSYVALAGRCRYCKERISWHYPVVELITGFVFVVILRHHYLWRFDGATEVVSWCWTPEGMGMLVFACTLIAVCVTDFRAKLIPHEITYPSMLAGILYSGTIRHGGSGIGGIGRADEQSCRCGNQLHGF